jgi:hypothetical protein
VTEQLTIRSLLTQNRERQRYIVRHLRTLHNAVKGDDAAGLPRFSLDDADYDTELDGDVEEAVNGIPPLE